MYKPSAIFTVQNANHNVRKSIWSTEPPHFHFHFQFLHCILTILLRYTAGPTRRMILQPSCMIHIQGVAIARAQMYASWGLLPCCIAAASQRVSQGVR